MKLEKIEFDEPGIIFLSKGTISQGKKPYWAYVMIPAEKFEAYVAAKQKGSFDLRDFGYIICWDEGDDPPKDIRDEMAELYNVRDDFVEFFMDNLKQTREGQNFIREIEKIVKQSNNN